MQRLCLFAAGAAVLIACGCAGRGEIGGGGGATGSGSTTGSGSETGSGGAGSATGAGSSSGGPDGGSSSDPDAGPTVAPLPSTLSAPSACTSSAPGPRKLWRLSGPEFAASIHSIFNDTAGTAPVATVFSDPTTLGFSIDANSLLVQGLNASQLEDNAEAIAAWAAANSKLSIFASCTTQTTACAATFIQGLGRRAFRTTLAASDPRIATYTALFMAGSSFSDGAQAVISAMLQSPYFLYRSELGAKGASIFALTPFEVATELAYTLSGNTPDDTLLTAADSVVSGKSTLASMVDTQAQRLLATASASNATAVMGFMNGWLGLPRLYTTAKDATVFVLSQTLQDDMATESQDLILEAFNGTGTIGSVLAADHSFLNKDLATFYGLPTTGLGTTFTSVPYAGTGRDPGLLATGTILNGYARPNTDSPTQRGHMVRSRMLCQDIPPPPAGLNTTFMPSTTVETTRDHFINEHEKNTDCASCHTLMDWIGFAFESYDGWGRHRTTDNGLPVVNTGTIYNDPEMMDDSIAGLSGTGSLAAYLAQSDDVTRCMMRYWTYFSFGSSGWSQDACTYSAIYQEAQQSGFALKSVLMAILHTPTFTTRVQDQ
jgi:hypothetical protein